MALTVTDYSIAIRASTAAPAEPILSLVTRLKGLTDAAVARYAPAAPEAVRDEASVLMGGYLWDGPQTQFGGSPSSNALRHSGAASILAPYRVHSAGIIGASQGAGAPVAPGDGALRLPDAAPDAEARAGIADTIRSWSARLVRVAIDAAVATWAKAGDATLIPAEKLANAPGASGAITGLVEGNTRAIGELEAFQQSLRRTADVVHRGLINAAIGLAAYRPAGNPHWPAARADRRIQISVNPSPSGTTATYRFPLSDLLAKPAVLPATPLNTGNAIGFGPSDNSYQVFVARTGGNEILIGADSVGDYYFAILDSEADLEDFARASSAAMVPDAKIPAAIARTADLPAPGLGQAAVDARITAAIPVARRVPAFASDDKGDALRVNAAGTAIEWSAGGLGQAEVDARVNALVPEWARRARRFTDEQQAVFDAFTGDDVWKAVSLADGAVSNPTTSRINLATAQTASYQVRFTNQGPTIENAYIAVRLKGRPANQQAGLQTRLDVTAGRYQFVEQGQDLNYPPTLVVPSTRWTYLGYSGGRDNQVYYRIGPFREVTGESLYIEEYDELAIDGSKLENFYVPAPWAREGNTDDVPAAKIPDHPAFTSLADRQDVRLAITATNAARQTLLTSFTTPFVLGSDDYGVLIATINWSIVGGSGIKLGADVRDQATVFLSDVRALTEISGTAVTDLSVGQEIGEVDVVATAAGNAKQGTVKLAIGRQATTEDVGVYAWYVPESGASATHAGTVHASLDVLVFKHDAPAAGGSPAASTGNVEVLVDYARLTSTGRRTWTGVEADLVKIRTALMAGKVVTASLWKGRECLGNASFVGDTRNTGNAIASNFTIWAGDATDGNYSHAWFFAYFGPSSAANGVGLLGTPPRSWNSLDLKVVAIS